METLSSKGDQVFHFGESVDFSVKSSDKDLIFLGQASMGNGIDWRRFANEKANIL